MELQGSDVNRKDDGDGREQHTQSLQEMVEQKRKGNQELGLERLGWRDADGGNHKRSAFSQIT
jgi:hypothetical protein